MEINALHSMRSTASIKNYIGISPHYVDKKNDNASHVFSTIKSMPVKVVIQILLE